MNSTVHDLVWCVFPVSGAYTQFQRILFWVVTLLALFCQFHDWLTASLIAFAITSSVTAAVHSIILGTQKSSSYDADLLVLEDILQSSIFATLLFILFSPRLFKKDVTTLYWGWCLLTFVARMVMQYTSFEKVLSIEDIVVPVSFDWNGVPINPCENMAVPTLFRDQGEPLTPVIWSAINVSSIPTYNNATNDTAILRWRLRNFETNDNWISQAPTKSDEGYDWLCNFWIWYLCLGPMLQCALVNSWITPGEARNWIFRRLRKRYVPKNPLQSGTKIAHFYTILVWLRYFWIVLRTLSLELYALQLLLGLLLRIFRWATGRKMTPFHDLLVLETSPSRARYITAKTFAAAWYFTANLSYVMFIGLTTFFTYQAEVSMKWLPESESKKAVGQWAPWMTLGLGVTAAVITRMVSKTEHNRGMINLSEIDLDEKQTYEMAFMAKELTEDNWHLHQYIGALLIYESQEFKFWWQNTIEASVEKPMPKKGRKGEKEPKAEELKDVLEAWGEVEFVAKAPNALPKGIDMMPQISTGQDGGEYDFYDFMTKDEIENMRKKFLGGEWKSNPKKTELKNVGHDERKED